MAANKIAVVSDVTPTAARAHAWRCLFGARCMATGESDLNSLRTQQSLCTAGSPQGASPAPRSLLGQAAEGPLFCICGSQVMKT